MPQPTKRRLQEIDDTIEKLSETLKQYGYSSKSELECSLMTAKLKREKLKALAAAAQTQIILAEMDVLIAETDLYSDIQRLKNYKKIKMDDREKTPSCGCKSSKSTSKSVTTQNTATEVSDNQKKDLLINEDTASNDTVLVPPINLNNTESVIDTSQSLLSTALSSRSKNSTESKGSTDGKQSTDFNQLVKEKLKEYDSLLSNSLSTALSSRSKNSTESKGSMDGKQSTDFNQLVKEKLKEYDSLLSNSVYAEFNTPYNKSNTYTPELKPKKQKTGSKKRSSKSKSKENKSSSNSKNNIPESKETRLDTDCTKESVRHNMPLVITQPKVRLCDETPCTSRPTMYAARPMLDVQPFHRPGYFSAYNVPK